MPTWQLTHLSDERLEELSLPQAASTAPPPLRSQVGWLLLWSHVWGHFCLCYKGQKLVDDKASVRLFGIKDEDELRFVRHLSINDGQEQEERPVLKQPSANINSLCVEMVKTLTREGW
ncbi:hypothetical protein FH972_003417 [Carpinus fangiana]|uniref:SNRNP25 ubiquitin-like domain-containing protein n=1 Tax=Carpinus fangiana TaxID=176857 RepID=A0A5N6QKK8_9ROSI|nr:hypothetical protein FH972_003417 [Carpinus fangiana]